MSITFTKLFSSITESTIWTEDHPTRLVWITMLAMADRKGRIWASIPGLANRARVSLGEAEMAINKFLEPDAYSRTKEHEGRRITEIDGGWALLNYEKYRAVRDEETIRESKRKYINNRRAAERVENVEQSRPLSTQAEAEAEAEAEKKRKRGRFTPPSLHEVTEYCKERKNLIIPELFIDFYESKDWMVGKSKMKDWKASVRVWEVREPLPIKSSHKGSQEGWPPKFDPTKQCRPSENEKSCKARAWEEFFRKSNKNI